MKVKKDIYKKILDCPAVPPETGGIIGKRMGVVCEYFFDQGDLELSSAVYRPDIRKLNDCIENWRKSDIVFCGIVHSHLSGQETLSLDDWGYINIIMEAMPEFIRYLYFPIVIPGMKIISYKVTRGNGSISLQSNTIKIMK